jgi:WD40 repeat protein
MLQSRTSPRSQYLADLRLAAQFVRNNQAASAIGLLERNRPRPGETDVREFTWYHLLGRCRTERRALSGHRGDVYHVEFSPNGELLASVGEDGVIRIWDTSSWRLVRPIAGSKTEVDVIAFSPDGAALAAADDEGKLKLWEVATARCRWEVPAHDGEAIMARFTRDGKQIITAGRDDHSVKFWNPSSGTLLDALPANGFILAPDGATIATVGDRGEIDLYNSSTRKHGTSLRVSDGIEDAAFSHDGRWLATAHGADLIIRLWDVSNRRLRHELRGHTDGGHSVAFAPDDRTLISAGGDATIRLWDVDTGHQRGVHLGHGDRIWGVAVSPDGRTIASASRDGTVRLWDSGAPEVPTRSSARGEQKDLAFSPDSRDLIGIGADGVISTWDAMTGSLRETWRVAAAGTVAGAVLSANGRIAAVQKKDQTIELHDLPGRRLQGTIPRRSGVDPSSLALAADGRLLAAASRSRGVSLWAVPGMSELATLEGDVTQILFTVDGGLLCTTEPGGRVISWNPADGRKEVISGFVWVGYELACLSPDGRVFAKTENRSIHVRLLDSLDHVVEDTMLEGHKRPVRRLALSPDGKTLASGDHGGVVKLWDVTAREELLTLEPHSGPLSSIRFSPDGRTLATCGVRPDGTAEVFLWHGAVDHAISVADAEVRPAHRH